MSDIQESNNQVPVFLINGFLEAGKTKFLSFTMEQEYFKTDGKTLLLVCEEGDTDYDKADLKLNNTIKIQIEDKEDISKEKLSELNLMYLPERIIIEWNGMWLQNEFELPSELFLNQQITIIDTSTFDLYLKNMKPFLGPMLKNSELVICNRADGVGEDILGSYYIQLKAMAPGGEIIFEGKDGEIRGDFNIELPYDIDSDNIEIKPEDFGIFYVDAMDRTDRYAGKSVVLTGQVVRPKNIAPDMLVIGRRAMTCCEADMQFLGIVCRYKGALSFKSRDWIKITADIKAEDCKEYDGVGPVLYIKDAVRTGEIDEIVQF